MHEQGLVVMQRRCGTPCATVPVLDLGIRAGSVRQDCNSQGCNSQGCNSQDCCSQDYNSQDCSSQDSVYVGTTASA